MEENHFSKLKRILPLTTQPLDHEPLNDLLEREHFCRIICAFKSYRHYSLERIDRNEQYLNSLPKRHQELLQKYRGNLAEFRKCVRDNQRLLNLIVKNVSSMFENIQPVSNEMIFRDQESPVVFDLDKVQTTLKQLVRDWSIQGLEERQACYDPIINEIVHNFPPDKFNPLEVKVLVPGAGLGRLAYEIVKRGYSCEGNEFSLFMLFASNFVLNKCSGTNLHHIHPWIHQFDNNMSAKNQMDRVSFPDVNPLDLGRTSARFTMVAGDFLEIYKESNQWDCVATCFFIDCAANIVAFVESIYNILKPGGLWINFGPLLYHFTNSRNAESVEISYEDLRDVITGYDFEFEKEQFGMKSRYAQNPHSMLQYGYESIFFVCRKPNTYDESNGIATMFNEDISMVKEDEYGMVNEDQNFIEREEENAMESEHEITSEETSGIVSEEENGTCQEDDNVVSAEPNFTKGEVEQRENCQPVSTLD